MDRYRLAPVRDARDRNERMKRGDLAVAVGAAAVTAEDVAAAAHQIELAREAIAKARAGATPGRASLVTERERFLARLRRDLDLTLAEHARAAAIHAGTVEQLDDARGRLARARADREVIERHFARWRTERKRVADMRAD